MLKVLDARVVSVKYKLRKRGSALLIVVVLVLLLAMMGTAFLMTVRISRDQVTGTGSSAVILPQTEYWPTTPNLQMQLDAGKAEIETLVQTEIQNAVRPGGAYRRPDNLAANDFFVAPQNTRFLAARAPSLPNPANLNLIRWNAMSEFAGRAFASPHPTPPLLLPGQRNDMFVGAYAIVYPTPFNAIPTLAGRTRIFPALHPTVGGVPGPASFAADADGDGIADAALFALTSPGLMTDTITLMDGVAHDLDYYGAVRIIDNAGAVNLNTAWRSTADRDATGADIPAGNYLSAYLGAFRPNVGLYELLRGVTPTSRIIPDAYIAYLNGDFTSTNGLDVTRMGQANAMPPVIDDSATTPRADVAFLTQGDTIEHQLIRRLKQPGRNAGATPPVSFGPVPTAEDDLAYRFCLSNSNLNNTTQFRTMLNWSAFHYSPNYSNDGRKRFRFFGASQADFWFHSIFNSDSTAIGVAPDGMTGTRLKFFETANANNRPNNKDTNWLDSSGSDVDIRKTARYNLVESNPISIAVADPVTAFASVPAAVKDVAGTDANLMPANPTADTPVKANVNTATFGELWKAYWSIFSVPAASPVQTRSAARRGAAGATAWTTADQMITRAAVAAVNTLTMRNPELASGTFTLPPTQVDHARAESRTFRLGTYDVTVYGVRKQPFITEVLIQRDETTVRYVAIELHNPYPTAITLHNYRLAVLNANTLGAGVLIPDLTIPGGGHVVLEQADPLVAPRPAGVTMSSTSQSVTGLLGLPGSGTEVVLLRPRRDDGNLSSNTAAHDTYNEANPYDLIPIDEFSAELPAPQIGKIDRLFYARPNVTGRPFAGVFAGTLDYVMDRSPDVVLRDGTLGKFNDAAGGVCAVSNGMRPNVIIPLANTFSDLIHPLHTGTVANPNRFPFGAFARDGDIAAVPFIGHYRIADAGNPALIRELNSVTVDATFAEDQVGTNDANEAVGRFVPTMAMGDAAETYEFAHRLFDYLTAVDVNPDPAKDLVATPQVDATRYADAGNATAPVAVPDAALTAGSQGRININTASWQVLAALPLVPGDPANTEALAKAIVADRDAKGRYQSIFDLNRVVVAGTPPKPFRNAVGDPAAGDFTFASGDLSPLDGVTNDYEQRIQEVTRISNLITTRSDSFTAYVLVQAWLDAGTTTPVLAAERRYVLQIDRSRMSKNNATATVTELPNQTP